MASKPKPGEQRGQTPGPDELRASFVNSPGDCPSDDELISLLDSKQPEAIEKRWEDHLADCPRCVDRLDDLSTRDSNAFIHHLLQRQRDRPSQVPFQTRETDAQGGTTIAVTSSHDQLESLPVVPGYQIEEEMARGGMGVVFRALDKRLERSVALKMVVGGLLAGPERISRFTEEAKTIAKLDHPNIVKVFDVGEYRGQPFFTMELIDGESLESVLDGAPWSIDRTVRLLQNLASALKATHEQGIVHRDLKPANILVQKDGELPRIIDFGLAKNFTSMDLTLTGEVMGTPSYMSPEQASGQNDQIGAESDVYALGIILYELLTGRPPFRAATLADTLQLVLHAIPVNPRVLNASIPVDLETICLKCLRKEPLRRYANAGRLADDLARFQSGRPINARRTPVWERGVKWCKRHPTTTIVSVFFFIAITAILAIWIRFTNDLALQSKIAATESKKAKENELLAIENENIAIRNERIAVAQLKKAERASAIQFETQQFILDLVQDVSAHGKDKELIQVLLNSEKKLNDRLDNRPLVQAVYLITLANTLQNFGEYEESLTIVHRAEELVRKFDTPDSNYLARAQLVELSIYLMRQEFAVAGQIVDRLSKEGVNFHQVDEVYFELQKANFEFLTGKVKVAEIRLQNLLDELTAQNDQNSPTIRLQVNRLLSIVLLELGEVDRAEPHLLRCVELAGNIYPAGHPTIVATENAYGIFLSKSGRADEAEELFIAGLDRTRETWGDRHPKTIETLSNLAISLGRQGKFAEAEKRFHESIDLAIEHLGRRHTLTINSMRSLAAFHVERKSYKRGFQYLSQVCQLKPIEEVAHLDAGKLALYYAWICVFAEEWQQAENCLNSLEKIIAAMDQPDADLQRDLLTTRKELENRRSD